LGSVTVRSSSCVASTALSRAAILSQNLTKPYTGKIYIHIYIYTYIYIYMNMYALRYFHIRKIQIS